MTTGTQTLRALVDGASCAGGNTFEVLDKYLGTPFKLVETSTAAIVDMAVSRAATAFQADMPAPWRRSEILFGASRLLSARRHAFIETLIAETGFTHTDAENEVERAVLTLGLCAEEARSLTGEMVALGATPGHEHRVGFTLRTAIGIVCAITPFNSPLNVVLHKIGPALAAGNAVILKPSGLAPVTASMVAELLLESGLPSGLIGVLHDDAGQAAQLLLDDQRVGFYTFTGSTRVGRLIQQRAGLRRTQLELGSIASTILCADADMDRAVPKIVNAAFRKAGQVCTSVQRLHVHVYRMEEALEKLVRTTSAMPAGNPRDNRTRVGPLISEAAAIRVETMIDEARRSGAHVLCGGSRIGSVVRPTILTGVAPDMRVCKEEVFGPVLAVLPFEELDEAIASANATPYGLSVGMFTQNLTTAMAAAGRLRFGAVHINETSSARADGMPFGGVKDSGFGREGPRYAIREYTEARLVTLNP